MAFLFYGYQPFNPNCWFLSATQRRSNSSQHRRVKFISPEVTSMLTWGFIATKTCFIRDYNAVYKSRFYSIVPFKNFSVSLGMGDKP
jgi:hypothetical protein